ncbi:MAG: acyltransferase [Anaeromyxobacteraceae bacterium]
MHPDSTRLTGHQPGLDGVRGFAILAVMALHFVGDAHPTGLLDRLVVKTAGYGLLGVDLFFVLSGFLITGLLLEAKGKPHYFRNFYARRTLRIFPLYYAVLLVAFLLLPLVTTLPPALEHARREQAWLWTYTSNFYIARENAWALGYLSHFWSLAIEEHFYLVWPLVVFLLRRETLEKVALGVVVAGLGLRVALALWGVSELSISVLTPARVDTLVVGAWLAAVIRRPAGAAPWLAGAGRAAAALLGAIVAVSAWCALTGLGLEVLHQVRNTLYALFFGAFTLLAVRLPGAPAGWRARVFEHRGLMTIGKYAYGLYVYHAILNYQLYLWDADARMTALLGNHLAGVLAKALLASAASFAVAVASYELFEKPFLSLKRHFETAPARPAPAPAPAAAADAGR